MKRLPLFSWIALALCPLAAGAAAPGNGLTFDGVDDYVNVGNDVSLDVPNNLTIEAWVKVPDLSQRQAIFSTRLNNEPGSFQLEVGPGSGGVSRVAVTGVGTWVAESGDNAIVPGEWTHIAYSRNGPTQQFLSINGINTGFATRVDYTFVDNTSDKIIGAGTGSPPGTPTQFFAGQIDEVRVWSTTRLSNVTDTDRLHELTGSESGLRAYYRFDETAGTTLPDLTANANDGTLVNMTGGEWTASDIPWFQVAETGMPGLQESFATWGDYDNDGALDIALAGYGAASTLYSRIYRNNNGDGTFTDIAAGLTPVRNPAVAWGDYDNDGDLDVFVAGYDGSAGVSRIYRNEGSGTFTDIAAGLTGVYVAAAAWGDYDNDGRPDLLVAGTTGSVRVTRLYHNDGGGAFSDSGVALPGVSSCSVAWGDYDNDGDLDFLLTGTRDGVTTHISRVYRNNGDGTFTDIAAGLEQIYYFGSGAWGDYDNDGDLDIVLTGKIGTSTRRSLVYLNDGGGTFTDIAAGLPGIDQSRAAWGDYDNDGKLDLVLHGWDGGRVRSFVFHNDGGGLFAERKPGPTAVKEGTEAWGDADNDGKLDIFASGSLVARLHHNNVAATANTPPAAPSNLRATVESGVTTLAWDAATDAETPAIGLTYNLRVGSAPGAQDVFAGMADLSSGRRRVAAMGNANQNLRWPLRLLPGATYYWSVQAVDATYAGGAWAATESTITVPNQPVVTTAAVTGMTATGAQCGGNVTAQGDSPVTSRGVVWNTTGNPTLTGYDGITSDGSGLGAFTSVLSGLTSGVTYYVRAYASGASGTSYGAQRAFLHRDPATALAPPGNALVFDAGGSQYVAVANAADLDLTGSHTIEVWFKADALTGLQGLISKYQTSQAFGWFLRLNGTEVEFDGLATTGLGLVTGAWYHLAAVKDGSSYLLYVNGAPVALTGTGTVQITGDPVRIGSEFGGRYFTGRMDEARLWSSALSAQEVRERMHLVLAGSEPGLVAYYDFDEASGTTLHDRAQPSAPHDGTLTGMTGSEWARSTIPAGSGVANTQTEAAGPVSFPGIDLTMTFGTAGTADLTATRIAAGPPNMAPSGEPLSPYWVVDRFGTGAFSASLTFTVTGGLIAENEVTPATVHLYRRDSTSDGAWTKVADASAVSVAGQTATFDAITAFGQFAVSHDILARVTTALPYQAGGYSAFVAWGDYDNDGRLDLAFVGGMSAIYHNDGGGAFTDIGASLVASNYNSVVGWADYDKDGYLDLAVSAGSANPVKVYHNNGNGTFTAAVDLPIFGGYMSYLAWGDYDNDGYPDILAGKACGVGGIPRIYHNNGNGTFTDVAAGLPCGDDSWAAWGDYDNDGLLDFAISGRVFHNDGGGVFTLNASAGIPNGNRGSFAWGDYDNDGRLDAVESGRTSGTHVYRNNGDGTFTLVATLTSQIMIFSSVAWGDFDSDGWLDVLVAPGIYTGSGYGTAAIFHNDGDGTFSDTGTPLSVNAPPNTTDRAAWGDFDNDGKLDVVVMQTDATYLYRNVSATANTLPAAPSGLSAAQSSGGALLSWNAASDGETPADGLSYNLRIGTTPGAADVYPAAADLSTGWRRIPALGNTNLDRTWTVAGLASGTYYWSVQAVDGALAGGAWAAEGSFSNEGADLSITKTDGVTTALPGGSVTYTITATNAGPAAVSGGTVADTFPASLICSWTCVGTGGSTCTAAGSSDIDDTVNLPAGGSVTYTASCTIPPSASGTLTNTATITAPIGVTDPNPDDNSATDTDALAPLADLSITKTDGVTLVAPGDELTYTLVVGNAGPSTIASVPVEDLFPAALVGVSWTCAGTGGGTCAASGVGDIADSVALPAGASVTYTAVGTVAAGASGTLVNTATAAAPDGVTDPEPGNNSATDTDYLPEIFSDGFESGDTSAWSSTVPLTSITLAWAEPRCDLAVSFRLSAQAERLASSPQPIAIGLSGEDEVIFSVEARDIGSGPQVRAVATADDGSRVSTAWRLVDRLAGTWTLERRCAWPAGYDDGEQLVSIDDRLVLWLSGLDDSTRRLRRLVLFGAETAWEEGAGAR